MRLLGALLFMCVMWWSLPTNVHASTTYPAATCSLADVSAAIALTVDGDMVTIPAGSCVWASALTLTNKSISLTGAGIDVTTIDAQGPVSAGCGIDWLTKGTGSSPAGFSRLSGFTMVNTLGCGSATQDNGVIVIRGYSHNIRVDHLKTHSLNNNSFNFKNDVRGVVDHNTFTMVTGNPLKHMTTCSHKQWNNLGGDYGDRSWAAASTWGSADALIFEDNTFDNQMLDVSGNNAGVYATDDFGGCRSVYRFNTLKNTTLQVHGTESGGRIRSFRHFEAYRNDWTWSYNILWPGATAFRGGTFRVFDNDVTVTSGPGISRFMDFNNFRSSNTVQHTPYYTFGQCGALTAITSITRSGTVATVTTASEHGVHSSNSVIRITGASDANFNTAWGWGDRVSSTQFTYTVANTGATTDAGTPVLTSPVDGNTDATGYPCLDQIGAGMGVYYSGFGSNQSLSPQTTSGQALEPALIANNRIGGTLSAGIPLTYGLDVILANRDYYNEDASCTGATCATGIGRGTTLPTGCVVGTGYWKTNEGAWNVSTTETYSDTPGEDGVYYACTSTNVWTLAYTPYTYPHPLIVVPTYTISGSVRLTGRASLH